MYALELDMVYGDLGESLDEKIDAIRECAPHFIGAQILLDGEGQNGNWPFIRWTGSWAVLVWLVATYYGTDDDTLRDLIASIQEA